MHEILRDVLGSDEMWRADEKECLRLVEYYTENDTYRAEIFLEEHEKNRYFTLEYFVWEKEGNKRRLVKYNEKGMFFDGTDSVNVDDEVEKLKNEVEGYLSYSEKWSKEEWNAHEKPECSFIEYTANIGDKRIEMKFEEHEHHRKIEIEYFVWRIKGNEREIIEYNDERILIEGDGALFRAAREANKIKETLIKKCGG